MIMSRTTTTQIGDMIGQLLLDHRHEVNAAYNKLDGELTISVPIKIKGNVAEIGIRFSTGKVEDGGKIYINQEPLPLQTNEPEQQGEEG